MAFANSHTHFVYRWLNPWRQQTLLLVAPGSDVKKMDQLMSLDTTIAVRLLDYSSWAGATLGTKCFW